MAAYNTDPCAYECKRMGIGKAMRPESTASFSVFSGSQEQRYAVALHGIRRCAEQRQSVIVVHDDLTFESLLAGIVPQYWESPRFVSNASADFKCYDPLYGMKKNTILDLLVPEQADTHAGLQDYLSIMETWYKAEEIPVFGDYPYNLNLLAQLTRMTFDELNRRVLSFLPDQELARHIRTRLSAADLQRSVMVAVTNYAALMGGYVWTEDDFGNHTRISLASTIANQGFISIYAPLSDHALLDFLSTEMKDQVEANESMTIIAVGINLGNSESMLSLFSQDHLNRNYSTGIVATSVHNALGEHIGDTGVFPSFLRQHPETIVFRCHSVQDAQPFCDAIPKYYTEDITTSDSTTRKRFSLLPSLLRQGKTEGVTVSRREVPSIRIDEVTGLTNGALVWTDDYSDPILVDNLILY